MKIDPVHFFNARGKHVLTMEDQGQKIEQLEARVRQLEGLLDKATKQLRHAGRELQARNSEITH